MVRPFEPALGPEGRSLLTYAMSTPQKHSPASHCTAVCALEIKLSSEPIAAEKLVEGVAAIGTAGLYELDGMAVGVWEITPSVTTDIESDEVFVVISGKALVTFEDGTEPLELRPGTVARMVAGARTTWHVTKTLRKVYVAQV